MRDDAMSIEDILLEAEDRMEKTLALLNDSSEAFERVEPTPGWSNRSVSTTTARPRR